MEKRFSFFRICNLKNIAAILTISVMAWSCSSTQTTTASNDGIYYDPSTDPKPVAPVTVVYDNADNHTTEDTNYGAGTQSNYGAPQVGDLYFDQNGNAPEAADTSYGNNYNNNYNNGNSQNYFGSNYGYPSNNTWGTYEGVKIENNYWGWAPGYYGYGYGCGGWGWGVSIGYGYGCGGCCGCGGYYGYYPGYYYSSYDYYGRRPGGKHYDKDRNVNYNPNAAYRNHLASNYRNGNAFAPRTFGRKTNTPTQENRPVRADTNPNGNNIPTRPVYNNPRNYGNNGGTFSPNNNPRVGSNGNGSSTTAPTRNGRPTPNKGSVNTNNTTSPSPRTAAPARVYSPSSNNSGGMRMGGGSSGGGGMRGGSSGGRR